MLAVLRCQDSLTGKFDPPKFFRPPAWQYLHVSRPDRHHYVRGYEGSWKITWVLSLYCFASRTIALHSLSDFNEAKIRHELHI